MIVDRNGIPLSAVLSPGQSHEPRCLEPVLEAVRLCRPASRGGRPRRRPRRLAGDKGYSYRRIRQYLRRRVIGVVIPTRNDQRPNPRFDRPTYRGRNMIERTGGWVKECRALATRFE